MKIPIKWFVIITSVMLPDSLALAQQVTPESSPSMQMQSPSENPALPSASPQTNERSAQPMQKMDKMVEMCQRMMKNEEAAMPYVIGGCVLFGVLLFAALVLLIILEILWIKHWTRLPKMQNRGV